MKQTAFRRGNRNVQRLRCFLNRKIMELRHFDYSAQARPKFANRCMENSDALALNESLFRIRGTLSDLEMQTWVIGPVEILCGYSAHTAILADNHEGRVHKDAGQPRG